MLHWGLDVLPKVLGQDVMDHFHEAFCDPSYTEDQPPAMPCLNGVTGETMFHIPSTGARLVSRQAFRRVLSRDLDIRFDKKLAKVDHKEEDDKVTVHFEDGSQHEADIIIGADGPNSTVRRHLLGEERSIPKLTPWVISLATFQLGDAEKAHFARNPHPVWHMGYGPQGICAIAGEYRRQPYLIPILSQ